MAVSGISTVDSLIQGISLISMGLTVSRIKAARNFRSLSVQYPTNLLTIICHAELVRVLHVTYLVAEGSRILRFPS